ncbi:hypothetical protein AB685_17305 [Bacillus sp. LL01]|nr:hypothetical protein AB685_17305 [Bacillus sp. LL01]
MDTVGMDSTDSTDMVAVLIMPLLPILLQMEDQNQSQSRDGQILDDQILDRDGHQSLNQIPLNQSLEFFADPDENYSLYSLFATLLKVLSNHPIHET